MRSRCLWSFLTAVEWAESLGFKGFKEAFGHSFFEWLSGIQLLGCPFSMYDRFVRREFPACDRDFRFKVSL